jgi:hypothetical protein
MSFAYGPWARNLYPALPAAFAFGLMAQVANMPSWLFLAWELMVAIVVLLRLRARTAASITTVPSWFGYVFSP